MSFPPPTEADIKRVVDLVVETVGPLRIVLFGSAARGELQEGSDLDIMVVMPDGTDTLRVAQRLYVAKARKRVRGVLVDFIVTTPSRYEQSKDNLGSVYREIEQHGREVYASAA
jgi:predicted nucleotidyltransferase